MNARLLTVLLALAAALWAMPGAAAAADGGEGPALRQAEEPEEPEPIPQFWTVEESADGSESDTAGAGGAEPGAPAAQEPASSQTSTSPGGTAPGSGTTTTGPGAPASESRPPAAGAVVPDCDPSAGLRRALRSLRSAIRGRQLLTLRPEPFSVRVKPCVAGTFVLTIVEARTGTVLWRARRELRTTRRATLRMTMTRAGRRFVADGRPGQVVRMRLRAKLTPR